MSQQTDTGNFRFRQGDQTFETPPVSRSTWELLLAVLIGAAAAALGAQAATRPDQNP